MKVILVPTDFSPCAWNSLYYAMQFARDLEATVLLLHIFPVPVYATEMPMPEGGMGALFETAMARLKESRNAIRQEFGVEVSIKAAPAFIDITGDIESEAKLEKADLIIMGTQGADGIQKTLFGSQAVHVLAHAEIPVLVVPAGTHFRGIHKVVMATSYDESELQPMRHFLSFYLSAQPAVEVLHVKNGLDKQPGRVALFKKIMKNMIPLPHITFKEVEGKRLEAIETATDDPKADLLVMFHHKHKHLLHLFRKSLTREIAFHAGVPLLAIPMHFLPNGNEHTHLSKSMCEV